MRGQHIVVEKPIGYDLKSARNDIRRQFRGIPDSSHFDDYLGKEKCTKYSGVPVRQSPVQTDLDAVMWIASPSPQSKRSEWNWGGYYEHAGALRDMVQNHLMQLLCLVAMEPMVSFEADEIRNKKVDVLHAVRPIHRDEVHQCVVCGQYGGGGKGVRGYREEEGCRLIPKPRVRCAPAIRRQLALAGRALYLRTGKRLTRQASEMTIISFAVCRISSGLNPLWIGSRPGW